MKIGYDSLVIETTRRCNMHCAHCLRGDAENMDMKTETVDRLLETAEYIDNLTFSGGEPTLNLDIIRHVLEYVKEHNICVHQFYIVTNGKVVTDEFLTLMVKWYAYCIDNYGEEECCGVALSKDEFHEQIDGHNVALLSALSFFRPEDKNTDFSKAMLINQGRAEGLSPRDYRKRENLPETLYAEECGDGIYIESTLYLSCTGDIVLGCDHSYENMPNNTIGNVSDIDAFEKLLQDASNEAA